MGPQEISIEQLIRAGGPIMGPILICSIIALGIIISKLIYFGNIQTDVYELKRKVFALVKENKIKEAIEYCNTNPSPVAKILKAGILKFGGSREEIKETLEGASRFEIPKLEKHLTALATIANVSPLLGLLGTTVGMVTVFQTIQVRAAGMNPITPGDLAGGIWQALLTTVAGLLVAIPVFVAYNYCVSRVSAFILDMERVGTELVNFLCQISESGYSPTGE
jgi:biopolymer transport protein ExbB